MTVSDTVPKKGRKFKNILTSLAYTLLIIACVYFKIIVLPEELFPK